MNKNEKAVREFEDRNRRIFRIYTEYSFNYFNLVSAPLTPGTPFLFTERGRDWGFTGIEGRITTLKGPVVQN